ncbi:adenylosuccinate lyase [Candidatus Peregrinibacteria bacterium]|nr:adenylosuccinate lyase [Candidatus Peregrinibacteria bacterium]
MNNPLLAISPLDGRYAEKVDYLSQYFAEAALMRYRVLTEVEWFIFLFNEVKLPGTKVLEPTEIRILRSIYEQFDVVDAERVKNIEKVTNHDVKAIEYFLKEKTKGGPIEKYQEFIHFACTSEDINNIAYACMIRDFNERELMPILSGLVQEIYGKAKTYKGLAMLSRTHGQAATPTTLGKELINFVVRIEREMELALKSNYLMAKINGAVGNYNAHLVAYPEVDWKDVSKTFIESLGLNVNLYTTQIEPHDCYADIFDSVKRMNNIVLDFVRDMWTYISLGYFGQKVVKGEVGSSTMPHKVNPIDFENAEGNIGIANSILEQLASKLQISRMQRDLSDSTSLRNIGSAFAYCILAYKSTIKGFSKCEVNKKVIQEDLAEKWELLAEPIQVVMRKNLVPNSYEKLKELTRGKEGITKVVVQKFIKDLKIPAADKKRLLALTPTNYVGLAENLVDNYELVVAAGQEGCGGGGSCGGGCQGCGGH